jgi:hypothetical protein
MRLASFLLVEMVGGRERDAYIVGLDGRCEKCGQGGYR